MQNALTFDDVLLKPGYTAFERADVQLGVQLTKRIALRIPIVSSPMDTVTERSTAIAVAKAGGLGFIHRNLTIPQQAAEVRAVKTAGHMVGAAVGASPGYEARVKQLVRAGADILLIDCAHGHSRKVLQAVHHIKTTHDIEVIAGSVATAEGASALIAAGADALRVGMGPAAICTTRVVSGMGVPQLSAILETAAVARAHNISVIADGGISYSGDIVKALAAGASCVMLGKLLAATTESPGKTFQITEAKVPDQFKSILNGAPNYTFKEHRGMGSLGAMRQGISVSSEDEFHGKNYQNDVLVPEGVSGIVPCSGPAADTIALLVGGVTSGLYYVGAQTIPELWRTAQFICITQASLTENHPHHLHVTADSLSAA